MLFCSIAILFVLLVARINASLGQALKLSIFTI